MQTTRRELLSLVLIGLCILVPVRAGAQVANSDGDSGSALKQPGPRNVDRVQSFGDQVPRLITLALHQATMKEALRTIARQADVQVIYNDSDLPPDRLVTVTISDATVEQALAVVLHGTELQARRTEGGITVEPRDHPKRSQRSALQGSIIGRVIDAATGRPIPAVAVRLEEASLATSTSSEGTYRFAAVPAGTYTLTARRVGYERVVKSLIIQDGMEERGDFAMRPSPTILDQVVTTGTVIPTEVKALPSPISVVMADQIERTHALTLATILRQAVPTAVAFDNPGNPTATQISVRGASSLRDRGSVKVFIDGIEATDYAFAPVDPASIERIEVIRGPQAATVYGADAAGGVIRIFTKRGATTDRPRVDAKAAFGFLQTPYEGFGAVPRQEYSGSVRGGDEHMSYDFGGGFRHLSDYLPDGAMSRQSAASIYGGMRYSSRWFSADLSARYYDNDAPLVLNPELLTTGYVPGSRPYYTEIGSVNETIGVRLAATPTSWWHHELTIGADRYAYRSAQVRPRYTSPADTLRSLTQRASHKISVAYNTSVTGHLGSSTTGSLAVGVDHYEQGIDVLNTGQALNVEGSIETYPHGALMASLQSARNTGLFAQGQLGLQNMLFVTAGVRAEDNSTFGTDYGMAVMPRAGLTLVRDLGATTVKLRASYGRALRTPSPGQASGLVSSRSITLANPLLAAEEQRGWDGGVDLVFGGHASVSITGFAQKARNLIALMQVASSPLPTYQYQNVGEVSNRGLELEGRFSPTPSLRLAAQYGYVRSRFVSVGVTNGSVQVGDEPLGVPARTAGALMTVEPWTGTSITTGITYVGSVRQADFVAEYRCFASFAEPACPDSFLSEGSTRGFTVSYPALTKVNVSVTRELTRTLEAFLAVDNVTNEQEFEGTNTAPVVGRNTMLGLHIRL